MLHLPVSYKRISENVTPEKIALLICKQHKSNFSAVQNRLLFSIEKGQKK